MLRFPLNLTAFYVIGLAYGLADFSALACVCWLTAMTLGVAAARPALLPAMLLVVALFILLNVTLERLVGSWLERLLSRRRTRELFFALFILAMVSLNLIEPTMRRYGGLLGPLVRRIIPYFAWFPPSLAGRSIAAAAEARQRGGVDRIAHQRDRLFRDIAALRHARQAPARSLLSHLERCAQLDSSPVVGQKLR